MEGGNTEGLKEKFWAGMLLKRGTAVLNYFMQRSKEPSCLFTNKLSLFVHPGPYDVQSTSLEVMLLSFPSLLSSPTSHYNYICSGGEYQ